jgi:anoctamin-10
VVWPLTACSFLVNNWIEVRADAVKICVEMQRPLPWRDDTIGPWLDALSFLSWFGSITTSALVYMFSNDGMGRDGTPHVMKAWALLLTVFLSEQSFLAVRWAVRKGISKLDSPGRQKERRHRFMVRKRYIDENVAEISRKPGLPALTGEEVDRASLEEEARRGSLHQTTAKDRFWARQKGWSETLNFGARLIERNAPAIESKKER